MEHPSSVSAIITSLGNEPSLSTGSADLKKHLATTIAVSPPAQVTKRVLSTTAQIKKVEPTKKVTNSPQSHSFSPAAAAALDAIAKTTRYHDVDTHTHIMHAKHKNAKHFAQNSNQTSPSSTSQPINRNNTAHLRKLKQQYVNGLNRQYLGNVYSYNPFLAQTLTTPKSIHTLVASAPQQTYYIVNPDDITSFDPIQSNINLANFGHLANTETLGSVLNVPHPFNTNLVGTLSTSETFDLPQLPRPPPLTVNIPYHEFPTPTHTPTLINTANITKLYSIIGSSTPDPYTNYEEVQTKPSLIRKKVVKFSVTTHRPYKYGNNFNNNNSNKHGNGQHKHKHNNYHNNNNKRPDYFDNGSGSDNHQNSVNKISIVYNESSQFLNENTQNYQYQNQPINELNAKNKSNIQTTPKECLVTPSLGNATNENICNSNDLKIIIKFDGNSILNTTDKNAVKAKPKKKKIVATTTTTTPIPYYDSLSYESDETKEESSELGSFLEPIQNIFGFFPSERKPGKKGNKNKEGHKKKSGEVVNKYQTIILQTPAPPAEKPHKDHKSLFYKFLALLPILAILKPLGFGLWTLVLSPLLVIAIGGIALGVVLYPFMVISRKQIHYASGRSPRIVIHKHPRPMYKKPINNMPVFKKPPQPSPLGPGYLLARWKESERRKSVLPPHLNINTRKTFHNNRQQKRIIPIRLRKLQQRAKRRARDTEFQQWLLIQNNFNIRIMSPNHDYDY